VPSAVKIYVGEERGGGKSLGWGGAWDAPSYKFTVENDPNTPYRKIV